MAVNNVNPCLTCKKQCPTVPRNGCAWREPKEPSRGWKDVFDQIDYSRYAQQPDDNMYVWG